MDEDIRAEELIRGEQSLALLRRTLTYVRPLWWALGLCLLGSLLSASVEVVLPQVIRWGVDCYLNSAAQPREVRGEAVTHLALLYVALLVAGTVTRYVTALGLARIGQDSVLGLRRHLWEHFHRLGMSYFDRNPVGRLVTRAANDTAALADIFTGVLNSLLSDVLIFVAIWVALLSLSPKLCLVLLLLVPPLAWSTWSFKRWSTQINREIRAQLAKLNSFLQESVQGLGVIKSFTAQKRMAAHFEELNQGYYQIELRLVKLFCQFRPVFGCAQIVALALVLVVGGQQVREGSLSLGSLVAFISYLKMLFAPLDDLAEKFNVFQGAIIAGERLFGILDTPVEAGSVPLDERGSSERGLGEVIFEEVSFAYDPAKPVLKKVSFHIRPGQSVALVGPTGSGKTTITALLMRFYELGPQGSGRILVDGKPLEDWELHQLRQQIGLVQQELFLFRADLRRNVVLFGSPPEARLKAALEASRAVQVVSRMARGLEHPVGERGSELSQGERQLISFARALVLDPPILILDEATSSIDSKTEQAIQEALQELMRGRTSLVVAHRLSTIRSCDQILVLHHGEIVERGNHEELLASDGLYAHLYRTQMLEESLRARRQSTV